LSALVWRASLPPKGPSEGYYVGTYSGDGRVLDLATGETAAFLSPID
jgi:hypothetical protein